MGEKKLRELWTIEQLQNYLQLPRATTYQLVAEGKIPVVKLGKHRRFIPDEVETALRKMPK
jgi:excisionase family DNA binding protein